ncbi:MAG TPA: EF-hand domain-containing protein [Gammaproteobacteria bacterium]|nr:EF-hand domain-containing protein [Gammaproteobacteria bacterium]
MKTIIFTAALVSGLAGLVQAEETAAISFEDLDVNNNEALSVAETGNLPEISAQWSSLDLDGDGQLSKDEFAGYTTPAPAAGNQ